LGISNRLLAVKTDNPALSSSIHHGLII